MAFRETTYLIVRSSFHNISNASLSSIRLCANIFTFIEWMKEHNCTNQQESYAMWAQDELLTFLQDGWNTHTKNLGTINTDPVECRMREGVTEYYSESSTSCKWRTYILFHDNFCVKKYFIPALLISCHNDKRIAQSTSIEKSHLRQSTIQPKRIRQPRRLCTKNLSITSSTNFIAWTKPTTSNPKPRLEVPLSKDKLPCERLTRRHVPIGLKPLSTDGLEFTSGDLGFDAFEEWRVELVGCEYWNRAV